MPIDIMQRRLRAGIVGGGKGSFIGAVHRMAVELDGQAQIIAGAMSSEPQRAAESARDWYLERSYASYQEMAEQEAQRPDGIDFVIIATPNAMHFPVAKTFLEHGIHVVSDKPMTRTLQEAQDEVALVEQKKRIFALTHNYTGYPMVRQAHEMVRNGELGEIRKVLVEYVQGWLLDAQESQGNKQARWRTDPAQAGIAGCVGDIGTHAESLLSYITDLQIDALSADLTTFVPNRRLDDDANMLLRMSNGAKGILTCSQIAAGEENNLTIRIYGTRAGLEWHQMEPNTLVFKPHGQPSTLYRTNGFQISTPSQTATRLPAGHPEGFLEAFANLYRAIIADIKRADAGEKLQGGYPTVYDGLRGMLFITKAVESSQKGGSWVSMHA